MLKSKINKKKFVGIAIILLFILVLLTIVLLYFYCKDEKNVVKKQFEYINSEEWNGELYPDGMPALYRSYSGSLTCQNIGKSFYYVTNTIIPQFAKEFKNYTETEILEYFENNKESIAISIGIRDSKEFYELINKIQEIVNTDDIQFEKFYIDLESIEKRSSITNANLCIKYKNCDELILNIRINGTKTTNVSSVKYN